VTDGTTDAARPGLREAAHNAAGSGSAGGASARLLIALDVDGTVLHEDGTASRAVADALTRAADAGHEVTFATGRSWETVYPLVERFGLRPEYVVCSNGAITMRRADAGESADAGGVGSGETASAPIEHGYRRAHVETFDASGVLELVRQHVPRGAFMVELADGRRLHTAEMEREDWFLGDAPAVGFDELGAQPVSRVVVISPSHDAEEFLAVVEGMGLHQVTYAVGWAAWLDIAPEGVSKGSALARVLDLLGLPGSALLAVGDGRNDVEMFRVARDGGGRAVAMGQAPEEVKAVAGEVTATVERDGLADVLGALSPA
jgi:hydroxymethylpyrimidine pyrophosphatase-like HAD family hydrolase